jgi:hypothetical protein
MRSIFFIFIFGTVIALLWNEKFYMFAIIGHNYIVINDLKKSYFKRSKNLIKADDF